MFTKWRVLDFHPLQVVKEWSPVSISGNAAVIGLTPGDHHIVCSVPGHCAHGMKFTVTVLPGNGSLATEDQTGAVSEHVICLGRRKGGGGGGGGGIEDGWCLHI